MAYTRVNWEDLPSTNTPRNATNLNIMDAGIKENDERLNGTKPMGSIVVDDVSCKNMLQSGVRQGNTSSTSTSNRLFTIYSVKIESGKTYTVSTNLDTANFQYAIRVAGNPFPTSSTIIYSGDWKTTTSDTWTATTDGYLGILISKTNTTANISPSDIGTAYFQVEVGNEATTYTQYKNFDNTAYILWSNTDPTSTFAGQTITLNDNISNYSYYEIIYKRATNSSTSNSTGKIPTSLPTQMNLVASINYIRTTNTPSSTSLSINDCVSYQTYGSTVTTTSNTAVIPMQVIGYK